MPGPSGFLSLNLPRQAWRGSAARSLAAQEAIRRSARASAGAGGGCAAPPCERHDRAAEPPQLTCRLLTSAAPGGIARPCSPPRGRPCRTSRPGSAAQRRSGASRRRTRWPGRDIAPPACVAAELGHSPAQLALAWLLSRSPDMVAIPGTKRVKYLEENVAAASPVQPRTAWPDALLGDAHAGTESAIPPSTARAGLRDRRHLPGNGNRDVGAPRRPTAHHSNVRVQRGSIDTNVACGAASFA
jgi:Aldo/keto reductase family